MADRSLLKEWVVEALRAQGGSAHHIAVAKHIWKNHQSELMTSDDLLYTWHYDMRWAANDLRKEGTLLPKPKGDRGPWRLTK